MERPKVLIVEDEAIVAKTLQRRVGSLGYDTMEPVFTGEKAIEMARETTPDIVLMDIRLRGDMDGIRAAELLREELDVPVIYLTAYSDEGTLERAKITEPFGYMIKPFEVIDLKISLQMGLYRHRMEKKLRESEERYRTLFEMSMDAITLIDRDGKILEANMAFMELLGKGDGLIGSEYISFFPAADHARVMNDMAQVYSTGGIEREYDLIRADGTPVRIETASSLLMDPKNDHTGIITISRDISRRKKEEMELRKKLMKYRLDEGNVYLVQEPDPNIAKEAFLDLLGLGKKGVVITRIPPGKLRGYDAFHIDHWWLAERADEGTSPRVSGLLEKIENIPHGSAILIDRLDYIHSRNNINDLLALVHQLCELAYLGQHTVILSCDRHLFRKIDMMRLTKETLEIEPVSRGRLPEELWELVKVVFGENRSGSRPTYSFIGQELRISKPTARKRINRLINGGYLHESTKGRTKVLEITGKCRNLFDR